MFSCGFCCYKLLLAGVTSSFLPGWRTSRFCLYVEFWPLGRRPPVSRSQRCPTGSTEHRKPLNRPSRHWGETQSLQSGHSQFSLLLSDVSEYCGGGSLLAVDHNGHAFPWLSVTVAPNVFHHVHEVLRFLRQARVLPFQELELFHQTNVLSLGRDVVLASNESYDWNVWQTDYFYLDVMELHLAGDENRRGFCTCHFHLKVPKGLLVVTPVHRFTVLSATRDTRKQTLNVPKVFTSVQ